MRRCLLDPWNDTKPRQHRLDSQPESLLSNKLLPSWRVRTERRHERRQEEGREGESEKIKPVAKNTIARGHLNGEETSKHTNFNCLTS